MIRDSVGKILFQMKWAITGEISRVIVEDMDSRSQLLFLPFLGWVLSAVLIGSMISLGPTVLGGVALVLSAVFIVQSVLLTVSASYYVFEYGLVASATERMEGFDHL